MRVLITGASGFVGRNLCRYLAPRHSLRLAVRDFRPEMESLRSFGEVVAIGEIGATTDWSGALIGVDAIVHLANRAHVMREQAADSLMAYRSVNVEGTRRLAEQAALMGVRRLVYLSSVKVLGEHTLERPFDDTSTPAPADPYGRSKLEAEQALGDVAASSNLEIVVLRPTLIYGPGVGANFRRLMHWVARGIPLPLAGIQNRRSLLYVDNLASAIEASLARAAAAGKTFLLSDAEHPSTAQLVSMLASALQVPDRLWTLPPRLLRFAGRATGLGDLVARLVDSLEVDDSAIRRELEWSPPISMAEGLRVTAAAYRNPGR